MSPPPAKCKRAESAPIKHSARWFDDGNVVLQAENTQFRVHWSVLALHSSVFRDMRGLPKPLDEPNVDGCPIVKLPDDRAIDVEYLLDALYDGPTFLGQTTLPLAAIGAFIRLGRKYDFKNVLNLAVARVTAEYPTTLEKYDAMRQFQTIQAYDGIEFDMVTLLRQNKIFSALPCACYRAVHLETLGNLFEKIPQKDGTCAYLSEADLRTCAVGHQTLSHKQFEPGYTFGWAREEVTDCTSLARRRASREKPLCCLHSACQRIYDCW
ncbi:BTB domain-containing protein [Mycena sanguinolenta]|uniref:BTB domain-containing protein n=1 Tax=Mycena sanguinolenta TaxID=230812 RepID=A0A8H6Z401_9AGAR|nr:BTB domain-containing protein [Mycena sanguinolenta]